MPTQYMYPIGVGSETAITTLFGAATHWQAVAGDDGDTSYVERAGSGGVMDYLRDLFDLTTGLSGGTISGVYVFAKVKKNNYANFSAGVSIRTNATTYDGDQSFTVAGSYQTISWNWATNPFTGVAWTWAEVNALEAGVRLGGSGAGNYNRCTSVEVQVITSDFAYPTDTTTRVTNIIHRYNRGVYNLEMNLGSLSTEFTLPQIDIGSQKSYQSKEAQTSSTDELQKLLTKALNTVSAAERRAIYEKVLLLNLREY